MAAPTPPTSTLSMYENLTCRDGYLMVFHVSYKGENAIALTDKVKSPGVIHCLRSNVDLGARKTTWWKQTFEWDESISMAHFHGFVAASNLGKMDEVCAMNEKEDSPLHGGLFTAVAGHSYETAPGWTHGTLRELKAQGLLCLTAALL
ncbi:hypothetical protein AAL_06779 [Moelleriella libera RCEF 2490]|uniref:Uncharacterized protein n=1 Tax=Moelleriella libera RCEF 2490 TaxID=1081109 RepID=A0A167Y9T8_9HYPO|nr:hypothetical protein AAL_06779 [Moelleriella libera RCEF 2490]